VVRSSNKSQKLTKKRFYQIQIKNNIE